MELESERPAIQGHPRVSFVVQGHSVHTPKWTSVPQFQRIPTVQPKPFGLTSRVSQIWRPRAQWAVPLGGEEETSAAIVIFGVEARAALGELDHVDLEVEFATRACVMKSPPAFLKG